ncbi:hypothetical protein NGA_0646100 [Nannochloropsis gaditana CCMP526]|uniref:uncharacterized protein n=1 Tax=Nannochloropsis gaditana (strain CCMP526) TaxID=1093141 RepID=UPI00029F6822|nr:hypothetical protein NGA_0646100 [Nannochloropsis gaditana CCMP526]EKU20712.1 hypothetical protein NGA_0646100 [Nannochloropsis gaditana CCMP526]|eukprot:XP_005855646.1 hypothetical protein NGA_0646100 [Nannochloropsis gaditana CCMP526]
MELRFCKGRFRQLWPSLVEKAYSKEAGFTMGASCPYSQEGLVGCHAYSVLCVKVGAREG